MPPTAVRVALMYVVIPIATSVGRAQQSGPPLAALEHATWTIRDGAPTGVRALAQSADGALWIGATTGLYRFDGIQFEPFEAPARQTLPSLSVSALLALPDGRLWIGYAWGGVSELARGRLTHVGERTGLPDGSVTAFARDSAGDIWAATTTGLARLRGDRWQRVGPESGYPGGNTSTLVVDRRGTLWTATTDGVFSLARGVTTSAHVEDDSRRISWDTVSAEVWMRFRVAALSVAQAPTRRGSPNAAGDGNCPCRLGVVVSSEKGTAMQLNARLTTPRRLLLAVGVVYLMAWYLPSAIGPFGEFVDGLEATRQALSPLWAEGWVPWWAKPLSVASALTNVVFVVTLLHAWGRTSPDRVEALRSVGPRPFGRAVWAVSVSALLNLYWMVLWEDRRWLAVGYPVWLFAFVALAVVLAWVRRVARSPAVMPNAGRSSQPAPGARR